MLSITDLNTIIKYFANQIQLRIEELDHSPICISDPQIIPNSSEIQFIALIAHYNNYSSREEKEVKLGVKLKQRIIQIYEYFKMRSNNQNLLSLIQTKIDYQLTAIVSTIPLRFDHLFSYINLITKRGSVIRPPAEKRRTYSRSLIKQSPKVQIGLTPIPKFIGVKKRPVQSTTSNKRFKVLSSAHPKTSKPASKWKTEDIVNVILEVLDLDRFHMFRIKNYDQNHLVRDALHRNQAILTNLKKIYHRKTRKGFVTENCEQYDRSSILSQAQLNSLKMNSKNKNKQLKFLERKKNTSAKENISLIF